MTKSAPFKICTTCQHVWPTREAFLQDNQTTLIGYQPNFDDLEMGLFYFNHDTPSCGTTLSFIVSDFSDLYEGPIYQPCRRGTADCPRHCLHKNNLEPCPAQCCCVYVRNLMQILRNHREKNTP